MQPSKPLFGHSVRIDNVTVINGVASLADVPLAVRPAPRSVFMHEGRFVARLDHEPRTVVDGTGLVLVPGLIDLQANDFRGLQAAGDAAKMTERFRHIAQHVMLPEGTTSFVLTSLAMPYDQLLCYLGALDAFRRQEWDDVFENAPERRHSFGQQLIGGMVEGTFMNAQFKGCHNEKYVHTLDDPSVWQRELDEIIATGSVFAVNIAPDVNPVQALAAIRHVKEKGVIAAVGHAQPTGHQLRRAVEAGTEYVIHLGNGSTGTSWKKFHRGGMLQESLRNDKLHVTIIADGFHVSRQYIRDWTMRKDLSRVSFVTDRAFAMEGPEPAETFNVFGITGHREMTPSGDFLRTYNDGDPSLAELLDPESTLKFTLFGAAVTMIEIFRNVVKWYSVEMEGVNIRTHPAYDRDSALAIAVTTCCLNPARVAKMDSDFGRIEPGYVANCVLLRVDEDSKQVAIEKVFLGAK